MSKKSQIMDAVSKMEVSEDLKEYLLERVSKLTDEPSDQEMAILDDELASLQLTELEIGAADTEIAEGIEKYVNEMDQIMDDYTFDTVKSMHSGLLQAEEIANVMSA